MSTILTKFWWVMNLRYTFPKKRFLKLFYLKIYENTATDFLLIRATKNSNFLKIMKKGNFHYLHYKKQVKYFG